MVAGKLPDWLPSGWTVQSTVKNGRKVECYCNPETGQKFYSKNDVIRYVEMGAVHTPPSASKRNKRCLEKKPMELAEKEDEVVLPSTNKRNKRSSEKKPAKLAEKDDEVVLPSTSKRDKRSSKKKPAQPAEKADEVVPSGASDKKENVDEVPEWLPDGWTMELRTRLSGPKCGRKYKCFTEPVNGWKFYSKPEVDQYLQKLKSNNSKSKKKTTGSSSNSNHFGDKTTASESSLVSKVSQDLKTSRGKPDTSIKEKVTVSNQSTSKVVLQRVETPDELPTGWIKEIKIQKKASGIRKDPLYTDPASGYVFRSIPDALRYLETGDISKCAIKPKKRDVNNLEVTKDESGSQSSEDKLQNTTRKRLFTGADKESCDTCSVEAPGATGSKRTRREKIPPLAAEVSENKTSPEAVTAKKTIKPSSAASVKTKDSKKKLSKKVIAEKSNLPTPKSDALQDEKKTSNKKTEMNSSKRKNNKDLSLPSRSSKRLLGVTPEVVAGVELSERALLAAARKSGASEALVNDVLDSVPFELGTETRTKVAGNGTIAVDAPSDLEHQEKSKKPLEDQTDSIQLPRESVMEQKDDENTESNFFSQLGNSWSDPCLEFAFKTLTGAIPIENNPSIPDYVQQREDDNSHQQRDGFSPLADLGLPTFFQSDLPSHLGTPQKPNGTQLFPTDPAFLAPGNITAPSNNDIGDQIPSSNQGEVVFPTKGCSK